MTYAQVQALKAARSSTPSGGTAFSSPTTRAKSNLSPDYIRNGSNSPKKTWPADGHQVGEKYSVINEFRVLTGESGFDLPTEALWEYACRAGTTTDYNCGKNSSGNVEQAFLKSIARHKFSDMESNAYSPTAGTSATVEQGGPDIVGAHKPNAWGLYDMHGNLAEWCLDLFDWSLSGQTGDDPWGVTADKNGGTARRVVRGGSYWSNPSEITSSAAADQAAGRNDCGFRLCLTIYE